MIKTMPHFIYESSNVLFNKQTEDIYQVQYQQVNFPLDKTQIKCRIFFSDLDKNNEDLFVQLTLRPFLLGFE